MTDLDKIVLGFIFSTIGIILGWTLNQLSSWFRARQEDKKNLKLVLFNLLETYNLFLRSDFEKYVSKISDKVFKKIPQDQQTEQVKTFINTLYSNLAENQLKPEILADLKKIENQYQDSILTLSKIDPLTAYYLSGKTSALERFEIIETWFEDIKTKHPTEATDIETGRQKVQEVLKPTLLDEILKDMDDDIRSIAWKINPVVWFKTRRLLRRIKNNTDKAIDKKIDELFKQFEHPI